MLLPHKERFTAQNAGAVSTVIYELARHITKKDKQSITIFGSEIDNPKDGVRYCGLAVRKRLWESRNVAMAKAYLAYLDKARHQPDITEVHGRPQVAYLIAKQRPDLKVVLYLHNDPRQIRGAKTVAQRQALSQHLAGIISITNYVKNCFLDGLGDEQSYHATHLVNHLGVEREKAPYKKREKQIFIASRMVPEKGVLEACYGAVPVLQEHPEWQIVIAGGKDFTSASLTDYERQIQKALAPLGAQAQILGHQPLAGVREYQRKSEVCIVPSLWQEPGGLTVLEALAAGAALITTKRGGIPEFATGRALMLDEAEPRHFEAALRSLITQPEERLALQKIAVTDYPFDGKSMSVRAVEFRRNLSSPDH